MGVRGRPPLGDAKRSETVSARVTKEDKRTLLAVFGSDKAAVNEMVRIARIRLGREEK